MVSSGIRWLFCIQMRAHSMMPALGCIVDRKSPYCTANGFNKDFLKAISTVRRDMQELESLLSSVDELQRFVDVVQQQFSWIHI